MCRCKIIPGPNLNQAQADFIGCLITAVIAAVPCFLEAFLGCLAGNGPTTGDDEYNPGTRNRCD